MLMLGYDITHRCLTLHYMPTLWYSKVIDKTQRVDCSRILLGSPTFDEDYFDGGTISY